MYLNYAEALNEYNPGHTDITKYVNLIRERAGLPALKSGLSQSEMREAIHHERRVNLHLKEECVIWISVVGKKRKKFLKPRFLV